MASIEPEFLLTHPELVAPAAPWCVVLDNLEMGIVLLTQPWVGGGGQRRADLERKLERLGHELPLGPIYFQRVNRAVARMEQVGVLEGEGSGRPRRFVATPGGFGTLILNLRVLRADPTVDGSEFELKRTLAAMCALLVDRLTELQGGIGLDAELESFFDQVEALRVWGRPVVTDDVVAEAFDVLGLIKRQRRVIEDLLLESEQGLAGKAGTAMVPRGVDVVAMAAGPELVEAVRVLATTTVPELARRAKIVRYRCYLDYLDELASMYAAQLGAVRVETVRGMAGRTAGRSRA